MLDTGEAITFLYWLFWTVGIFLLFVFGVYLLGWFQVFWEWVWSNKKKDDE